MRPYESWKDYSESMNLCKYASGDDQTVGVKDCSVCGAPLCSSCGYRIEGVIYCNECYKERSL